MNGEYQVIGVIVDKAIEEDGEGLEMIDCMKEYKIYKDDVAEFLVNNGLDALVDKISVFTFTHYS